MTTWLAGMRITADRLNDHTPTTTTTGLVAATGFTVSSFNAYTVSGVTTVVVFLTVGTTVTSTSGNVTPDVLCATLPSDWRPPVDQNAIYSNGAIYGEALISSSDGTINLRTANATFSGGNIRICATWIDA